MKQLALKEHKMAINKTQRKIIGVVIPIIVILIGFVIIGDKCATSRSGEGGITFNPFSYFTYHGVAWSFVVLLIGGFELFWWKDHDKKSE